MNGSSFRLVFIGFVLGIAAFTAFHYYLLHAHAHNDTPELPPFLTPDEADGQKMNPKLSSDHQQSRQPRHLPEHAARRDTKNRVQGMLDELVLHAARRAGQSNDGSDSSEGMPQAQAKALERRKLDPAKRPWLPLYYNIPKRPAGKKQPPQPNLQVSLPVDPLNNACEEMRDAYQHSGGPLLCIGIPSARRPKPVVLNLASELVAGADLSCVDIIVRMSQSLSDDVTLQEKLSKLQVKVEVDYAGYPDLERDDLPETLDDPVDRVRWRSRHVMDYANTMELCTATNAPYILMIEDDLQATSNLVNKMFGLLKSMKDQNFGYVTLFSLGGGRPGIREVKRVDDETWWYGGLGAHGAVALLFRRPTAVDLVPFLKEKRIDRPVDWLIPGFVATIKRLTNYEFIPNMFQHLGDQSTFAGNKDRGAMKSKTFRP